MDQVLDADKVMETSARVASCGEGARISRTSPTANAAPPASVNVAVAAKCSAFIQAYDQRSNDAFVLAEWLTGYLSAINQHAAETFDLAPWQSTEVLMLLAKDLCARSPDEQFYRVADGLATILSKDRLQAFAEPIEVGSKEMPMKMFP